MTSRSGKAARRYERDNTFEDFSDVRTRLLQRSGLPGAIMAAAQLRVQFWEPWLVAALRSGLFV